MKINTINYLVGDAFKSLKRNKTISIASVLTVLITFLVLGIFLLIAQNANLMIDGLQDKIEIQVYLTKDIKLVEEREIQVKIKEQAGVEKVTYESAEDAYNKVLESNPNFLSGYTLEKNPFPASYIVKISDADKIDDIIKAIKDLPGVESIENQQDIVGTIQSIVKGTRIVGIVLFIVLIAVSVFLIMNTTKLTVYSRRKEVGIMKFVGATDWFIRWPFIIEGMVIGLTGALLSSFVLFGLYKVALNKLLSALVVTSITVIAPSAVLTVMLFEFALGGIIIGGIASFLALRKFLKV
ncbi:permease-like cell division protein FtsX [Clostridium sp. MSJ-8]|uniref:permease-like cell division protein FtsX n=1 Tax=Clostridium sp. MSJ-8 TaxID=2841510 RepID=UPI001C0E92C4|nr:permease-like cell division protein FtsX [Clostridium sp. MSJ-8]MBU5488325.1 permease-like cell division protein FtsX [Clostridium sp. MSJ-8]